MALEFKDLEYRVTSDKTGNVVGAFLNSMDAKRYIGFLGMSGIGLLSSPFSVSSSNEHDFDATILDPAHKSISHLWFLRKADTPSSMEAIDAAIRVDDIMRGIANGEKKIKDVKVEDITILLSYVKRCV